MVAAALPEDDGNNPDEDLSEKLERLLGSIKSDKDADAILSLLHEIEYEESHVDPLKKFKHSHKKQQEFINATEDFVIALASNRFGKTFAMCFLLVSIALGKWKKARHQPSTNRVLRIWFVGKDYNVLNDTVLKDITGFMLPHQFKLKKDGPQVTRIYITADDGSKTEILFKPKSSDISAFESSSPHYIFVDEGVSPTLFKALATRMTGNNAQYFQCFTRLPHTEDENFLTDIQKGEGEFAKMQKYCRFITGELDDNPYMTEVEKQRLKDALSGDPLEYNARILGIFERPRGVVFDYKDQIVNLKTGESEDWNIFNFSELWNILKKDNGRWLLLHDYGWRDPACWLLLYLDYNTGTTYFVEEIYQSQLNIVDAGNKVHDMLHRWGCFHTIDTCIADKQIRSDTGQAKESSPTSILQHYLTCKVEVKDSEGHIVSAVPAFPEDMAWICKESYKRKVPESLQWVNTFLTVENPHTPRKPFYRFSPKCKQTIKELKSLKWNEAADISGSVEKTRGNDHAVACLRYFTMARTNATAWYERHNNPDDGKYDPLLGKSRGSYFNF